LKIIKPNETFWFLSKLKSNRPARALIDPSAPPFYIQIAPLVLVLKSGFVIQQKELLQIQISYQ